MKTMTAANGREQAKLSAAINAAQGAIYSACPAELAYSTPLSGCRVYASPEQLAAEAAANSALWDWERRMASEGRGWINPRGHFTFY